ncbi:hypothetical protein G9A89_013668 [Geosiphon pyriformis]|nr:hypothetical protein G9A89_013668 [Geosiphon pyriformis]
MSSVPIARLVAFGSKSWAQIVSLVLSSNNSHFGFDPGFGSLSSGASGVIGPSPHMVLANTSLETCLASLEHSVELLVDKVSGIVSKLENLVLVPPALAFSSWNLVVPVVTTVKIDSDMTLDDLKSVLLLSSLVSSSTSELGSSSSKILTSKVGCLKSKLMVLEVLVSTCNIREMNNLSKQADIICWHMSMNNMVSIVTEMKLKGKVHSWIADKFAGVRVFISGLDLGHLSSGVAIIMNIALAKHVCKVFEVSGHLISADDVNALIAGAVNNSFFIVLGGNFNEDDLHKSASFKKCGSLGLVNSLVSSPFLKFLTWNNSRGVTKTIDYLFMSPNLMNAIVDRNILDVVNFFNTDYQAVSASIGLGGLLNTQLCSICKQANKDC